MSDRIDDWPGLQAAKKDLRVAMAARLKAVTPAERVRRSQAAAAIASGLPAWAGADLILAFLSMPTEIDTRPVIELSLEAGKRVAVPRIDDGDLVFIELKGNWRSWPLDRWSIPTPPADAQVLAVAHIASLPCLALVPGLAFDRNGGRLGRGKGYYDRFLASVQAALVKVEPGDLVQTETAGNPPHEDQQPLFTTVAYGYDFQIIPRVPMGRHDVRLQGLALG
jgi:5-formyltetrahydrofolate cyclo-ligase